MIRVRTLTHETGKLKPTVGVPSDFTIEGSISFIDDEDDKRLFIDFVSRMLKWQPEDRSTAKQLIDHPWVALD